MTNDALNLTGGADRMLLIETFVRIVEAGSLSAAADQLGSTQPTISRRLQTLERTLGVRLLQRSTHAMKLTEDGRRCYERAKELISTWHVFESDVRGDSEEPVGLLRVVAPHAFGQQQLIGPLAAYLRRYPKVRVEWLLHDRQPDFIAEGVDCAIRVGAVQDSSMVALPLGEVQRSVVASPDLLGEAPLPRDAADLSRLPWLSLRTFYRSGVQLTHCHAGEVQSLDIQPRLYVDNVFALRNAAMQGLGAAVISSWLVADDLAAGRLIHLAPQWDVAALPVYLIYPQARFLPARLRRFIDLMRECAPAALAGDRAQV
ncbi:MAG: LysR family transcriptional regulator [Bordetella sp.]|uniref:LysR family transcriptional regulator n=1 Tax=Bordetella sp. TaxID=28081 RepID=UPI003F7B3BAD